MYFSVDEQLKFCAQFSWARKKFYNLEPRDVNWMQTKGCRFNPSIL